MFRQLRQVKPVVEELYALNLGSGTSYYNEMTRWQGVHNIEDWKARFWGDDIYDFLHKVKAAYDPCNILWVDRGVGSEDPKMTC